MNQPLDNQKVEHATPKKGVIFIQVAPGQTKVEFTRLVMENFCKHGLLVGKPK